MRRAVRALCLCIMLQATLAIAESEEALQKIFLEQTIKNGPDAVANQEGGPGLMFNLGPTGIRAILTDKNGAISVGGEGIQYRVKYVFADSPAHSKVLPGDIIVGVNGKRFTTPYRFGYWSDIGYEGPLLDLGRAIEQSEAQLEGRLSTMIIREGKPRTIDVQLNGKGAFSPTFPYECEKSRALRKAAVVYLVKNQENGRWHGSAHAQFMACMALLAQGKPYHPSVERYLNSIRGKFNDHTWSWQLAMNGMILAEYSLATGSKRYWQTMREIEALMTKNQARFKNGTYGHAGVIAGRKGYGAMCGSTSLVILSWTMMERAGLEIHEDALEKALTAIDMAMCGEKAYEFGYPYGWGWPATDKILALEPSRISSSLGDLHENIDAFSQRRSPTIALGAMSMVHTLRPWQDYSPRMAQHHTHLLARTRRAIVNGHGSGMLHAWSAWMDLAMQSNRADEKPFRITLDCNKAYINAARCHDGSFYVQPQRDKKGFDMNSGSRTLATGLWLTVLSAPDKKLALLRGPDRKQGFTPTP